VFDSPAKTSREILMALQHGVALNIDNFQELERVEAHLKTLEARSTPSTSVIGLRINPQIGSGTLPGFSTGTATSKFGFGLGDYRAKLKDLAVRTPWIRMLHCHVGSQGCDLDLITGGLRRIVDFANEINSAANEKRISTIDIGGGISVNFAADETFPTFDLYVSTIASKGS
jgi:diaminopimelate decarboxylase